MISGYSKSCLPEKHIRRIFCGYNSFEEIQRHASEAAINYMETLKNIVIKTTAGKLEISLTKIRQ